MKLLFTLTFILTLLSSAMAGVRIESHDDHSHEESHMSDHSFDSHEHTKKAESKSSESAEKCPHIHIHCTSLCLGVLLDNDFQIAPQLFSSREILFSLTSLTTQSFPNSLYRPPIS